MKKGKALEKLTEKLNSAAIVEQCAEECAEFIQALMKWERIQHGVNKTPISSDECLHNLLEECADVSLCIDLFIKAYAKNSKETKRAIDRIKAQKLKRWIKRLGL